MAENVSPVRFIRLGMRAGYLEAGKELHKRGLDFPSHLFVDRCLMEGPKKYTGPESEVMVRAREIFAYPKRKGVFERGRDIVDVRTGWVIPHSEVPQEAFGERFVGLCIDPEIEESGGRVIVHPKTLVMRHGVKRNFLGGYYGVVDDSTRIPNALAERKGVGKEMMRSLTTMNCGGIFVIKRAEFVRVDGPSLSNHVVSADMRPDVKLDVVGVVKGQP
ncbi:hypothetical protein H0O01_03595 [Candidatus Micrarchaeota archaeon]|nr:hypothetical protein [Candidatus Micrarchaeota archaeon]